MFIVRSLALLGSSRFTQVCFEWWLGSEPMAATTDRESRAWDDDAVRAAEKKWLVVTFTSATCAEGPCGHASPANGLSGECPGITQSGNSCQPAC